MRWGREMGRIGKDKKRDLVRATGVRERLERFERGLRVDWLEESRRDDLKGGKHRRQRLITMGDNVLGVVHKIEERR